MCVPFNCHWNRLIHIFSFICLRPSRSHCLSSIFSFTCVVCSSSLSGCSCLSLPLYSAPPQPPCPNFFNSLSLSITRTNLPFQLADLPLQSFCIHQALQKETMVLKTIAFFVSFDFLWVFLYNKTSIKLSKSVWHNHEMTFLQMLLRRGKKKSQIIFLRTFSTHCK